MWSMGYVGRVVGCVGCSRVYHLDKCACVCVRVYACVMDGLDGYMQRSPKCMQQRTSAQIVGCLDQVRSRETRP